MIQRKFQKSHGAHGYHGKYSSRASRFMSKLYKGIQVGNLEKAFKEVEALNGQAR